MSELGAKLFQIVSKAVHMAQEENRRLGIPNVYVLNGKLVWQLPDGTVTSVKPELGGWELVEVESRSRTVVSFV